MTNEELAVMAKAGDRSALAALWEQNTGLLATLFRRLYIRAGAGWRRRVLRGRT